MKPTKKKTEKNSSKKTENSPAAEALQKMKNFADRKEKIIASIVKSQN